MIAAKDALLLYRAAMSDYAADIAEASEKLQAIESGKFDSQLLEKASFNHLDSNENLAEARKYAARRVQAAQDEARARLSRATIIAAICRSLGDSGVELDADDLQILCTAVALESVVDKSDTKAHKRTRRDTKS